MDKKDNKEEEQKGGKRRKHSRKNKQDETATTQPTSTIGEREDEDDGNAADDTNYVTINNINSAASPPSSSSSSNKTKKEEPSALDGDVIVVSSSTPPASIRIKPHPTRLRPPLPSADSTTVVMQPVPSSSSSYMNTSQINIPVGSGTDSIKDKSMAAKLRTSLFNIKNSTALKFSGHLKASGGLRSSGNVYGLKNTADRIRVVENAINKALPMIVETANTPQTTGWHLTTRWSLLIWLEILFKSVGIITAFVSLSSAGSHLLISLLRILEIIIICPLLIGFILSLLASHSDKELFSFTFTAINGVAHIAVLITFLIGKATGINIIIFAAAETVGEIYRLIFLDTISQKVLPPLPKNTTATRADFDDIEEQRPHNQPGVSSRRQRLILGFIFTYVGCYLVIMIMETLTLLLEG